MNTKLSFMLYCLVVGLAMFIVTCADNSTISNNNNTGNPEYTGPFKASNVSAQQCTNSASTLNCFISVWNTEHTEVGSSASSNIVLPLVSNGEYDFYVDWGDRSGVQNITSYSDATHAYASNGEYTIYISGELKGWKFGSGENNTGDAIKLLDVKQWGTLSLGNTAGRQFQGAKNFNPTATDAPDVSETTSLSYAFATAIDFNGAIGNWDVSKVTDMSFMFSEASSFNNNGKPLDWGDKISNVTDMKGMFNGASVFNQDISEWDVEKVTNMESMFNAAAMFNHNLTVWTVQQVKSYDNFAKAGGLIFDNIPLKFRIEAKVSRAACASIAELNCFISVWNTGHSGDGASTNHSVVLPLVDTGMYGFFIDWGDKSSIEFISNFDDARLTHQYPSKAEYTIRIAGKIKGWRFYVEDDNYGDAVKLLDVSQWGSLSLGNTAGRQFQGAKNFISSASDKPNISETTDLSFIFSGATKFNGAIANWDVAKVTDMEQMFKDASAFNRDLTGWTIDQVENYGDFSKNSGLAVNNTPLKFRGLNTASKEHCETNAYLNCFISTWNTENSGNGASGRDAIVLPLVKDGTYNFYIDWGDGSAVRHITGFNKESVTHNYSERGKYTISIAGDIKGWRFYSSPSDLGDAVKLLDVTKWGSLSLGNTEGYQFYGAENFNATATDAPNLSETTSLSFAFATNRKFNGQVDNWDVSKVMNMWYMFKEANSFNNNNRPLNWEDKTSNVGTMERMFWHASNFNADISGWDVSAVTNMKTMFSNASSFNQPIGDWDVSKVVDMSSMFSNASSFNKPLNWKDKTGEVKTMQNMFEGASSFDQDISHWDVSKVTSMESMFEGASKFNNGGVELNWRDKTKEVTNISSMFANAINFNQEVEDWTTENVTEISGMFSNAASFNRTVSKLNVSNVKKMRNIFEGAKAFNQDISDWDVRNVDAMPYMFKNATKFNNGDKPLAWGSKTSNLKTVTEMFRGAAAFNQNISGWNLDKLYYHIPIQFSNFATGSGLDDKHIPPRLLAALKELGQ